MNQWIKSVKIEMKILKNIKVEIEELSAFYIQYNNDLSVLIQSNMHP